jgi:hypothetical protein
MTLFKIVVGALRALMARSIGRRRPAGTGHAPIGLRGIQPLPHLQQHWFRGAAVMSDDKKKTGKPDRDRVSANEPYEVDYLAKKYQLPKPLIQNVIRQEGPMRRDVEAYLDKMKK